MRRKGNTLTLLVGMQAGTATLENSMEAPQDVKNRATLRPSNCTTKYLPQKYKCSDLKGYLCPNVIAAMYTIANLWKEQNALQKMNGERKCGPYIQWNIT